MNTQVKVGIAAAIVAALVALIVLDQKTTPKDDPAARTSTGGDPATIVGTNAGAEPQATRLGDQEIKSLLDNAQKQFGDQTPAKATPVKGSEEPKEKRVSSTSTGEEYVIKEGDTLDKIAEKTMGSKSYASKIADANPGLKPTALRPGKKLVIPAKAEKPSPVMEKKEEPAVAQDLPPAPATAQGDPVAAPKEPKKETAKEPAVKIENGQKIYTVQPGDTLSGISVKVYNTSRHYQKIYEANKEAIEDPNTLQVGLKLTMPDLPSKAATANAGAPGTGAVPTTIKPPVTAPAGAKLVEVAQGDRLWTIAAKFASERKIGIMDMIKLIVDANAEKKIREDGSNLQAGWQLIIPE
jgi:nucleoid-associated protein YgaU